MKLPLDKQLHILGGVSVASTVALYSNPLYGVLACFAAAVGKEGYDFFSKKGTVDFWDAVATALGALVVTPLLFM